MIDQATFDAMQAHLRLRNPKVTPARVVSGPTLLTGICFCAKCAGAMTLRTGKGNRYRNSVSAEGVYIPPDSGQRIDIIEFS
jgi:site-specific DNA recombinase